MKEEMSETDDARLRALLQGSRRTLPLPPRFQENVWRRIEQPWSTAHSSVPLMEWIALWVQVRLARPALAVAYVTVLLVVGAGVGWGRARHDNARVASDLSARYAVLVDPYHSGH